TTEGVQDRVTSMFSHARRSAPETEALAVAVIRDGQDAGQFLALALAERQPSEVLWALRCLRGIKATRQVADITLLLGHVEAEVRAEAIWSLMDIEPASLREKIFELTGDPDLRVRRRAFDAAMTVAPQDSRLLDLAIDGLAQPDYWLFSRSMRVLAGADTGLPNLVQHLKARSLVIVPKLEGSAARMVLGLLAKKLGAELDPILVTCVDQGGHDAKAAAIETATRLRSEAIIEQGRALLTDQEVQLQLRAIAYLAVVRDMESVPQMINLLATLPDGPPRTAIVVGLRKISGRSLGFEPEEWRKWFREQLSDN
ncbi:MAG: HEAT repeat domain-containing protein, partial [Planctomycetes bacterium]|nr:HEAT repeat domain-containing protein [Planctomycetota bacterium]